MKFFSEKTNKYYNTADECVKAETEYDEAVKAERDKQNQLKENRAIRQKEVEDAILNCRKLLNNFLDDYGSFVMTVEDSFNLFDLLNNIF